MIARAPELEVRFYDCLRESFGSQAREGIHLSGLISPRQELWQHAKPMVPTDDELGYFTAGRGHEDALVRFVGKDFAETEEALIDGIYLRPDFVAISNRIIPEGAHAEFKTRRSNLPENDEAAQEEFSHYRAQVRGYMALKRMNQMYLVVLSLVEGKTGDPLSKSHPVFAIYVETMTDEELEAERQMLFARRDSLNRALDLTAKIRAFPELVTTEHTDALAYELLMMPLCESWMCGKPRPELKEKASCLTCGQVFESAEFGPRKHQESKKGAGHEIKPAVVIWHYEPRCKWYRDCRPWEIDPTRGAR